MHNRGIQSYDSRSYNKKIFPHPFHTTCQPHLEKQLAPQNNRRRYIGLSKGAGPQPTVPTGRYPTSRLYTTRVPPELFRLNPPTACCNIATTSCSLVNMRRCCHGVNALHGKFTCRNAYSKRYGQLPQLHVATPAARVVAFTWGVKSTHKLTWYYRAGSALG